MSPRFFFHSDSLITHARTISSRFLSKSESDIPSGKANVSKITNIVRFDFRRISLFYATSSFTTTLCHALRNDLNAILPPHRRFLPRRLVDSRCFDPPAGPPSPPPLMAPLKRSREAKRVFTITGTTSSF